MIDLVPGGHTAACVVRVDVPDVWLWPRRMVILGIRATLLCSMPTWCSMGHGGSGSAWLAVDGSSASCWSLAARGLREVRSAVVVFDASSSTSRFDHHLDNRHHIRLSVAIAIHHLLLVHIDRNIVGSWHRNCHHHLHLVS